MEKIIFLDIDGVLNDNTINGYLGRCVDCLREVVSYSDGRIVIISSLQGTGTVVKRKKLEKSLKEVGIIVSDFIDPNFKGKIGEVALPSRIIGIVDYLKRQVDSSEYVILDDEYHEDYKELGLNHYETGMWIGLRNEDVEKIHFEKFNSAVLNKINYEYRELGAYEQATNNLIKTLKMVLYKKETSKK